MATTRNLVFQNGEVYHIFNRGMDRRTIFTDVREFKRAKELIKFYRHKDIPIRFSKVIQMAERVREQILNNLYQTSRLVNILCYCLMPNHFHFLLKQNFDNGITIFLSNFTNAYTKYFDIKHKRVGPITEGVFKAVYIEDEEQLIHVSRYIHINPATSSIITTEQLPYYQWSSYPEYLLFSKDNIAQRDLIMGIIGSVKKYQKFVTDQVDYGKTLEAVKHLIIE